MTAGPRTDTLDLTLHRTTVQRGGEGPSLLYLHPEAGCWRWGPIHDALAAHFTVVAPVHPGFGGEDTPAWLDDVTDLAFHYAELIGAAELDRPVVVGSGVGGWIAAETTIHRPDAIGRLVLCGPLGLRPDGPTPDLFIMQLPEAVAHLAESLDGSGVDPLDGDPDEATLLWVEMATLARLMWERGYDPRLERRAHHAAVPTHVIAGTADRLRTIEHSRRYAELFGATFHTVPGAGHLVDVDAPAEVAGIVTDLAGP